MNPDDEPLRWAGAWKPLAFPWEQVERAAFLPVQIQSMLSVRTVDHAQSGEFRPKGRRSLQWALAHAQDLRPNAVTIFLEWRHFLPGTPKMDVAINLQRALEASMYFQTDFREWPVICPLMRTGIPRADEGRKQHCQAQTVFAAAERLWVCRHEDEKMREITCLI